MPGLGWVPDFAPDGDPEAVEMVGGVLRVPVFAASAFVGGPDFMGVPEFDSAPGVFLFFEGGFVFADFAAVGVPGADEDLVGVPDFFAGSFGSGAGVLAVFRVSGREAVFTAGFFFVVLAGLAVPLVFLGGEVLDDLAVVLGGEEDGLDDLVVDVGVLEALAVCCLADFFWMLPMVEDFLVAEDPAFLVSGDCAINEGAHRHPARMQKTPSSPVTIEIWRTRQEYQRHL